MKLTDLRDALVGVVPKTYHFIAPQQVSPPYIVWGETAVTPAVEADDMPSELRISGEVWYYTEEEYDANLDEICLALSDADVSWKITTVGRDTRTGDIVYGFTWEGYCGNGEIYGDGGV